MPSSYAAVRACGSGNAMGSTHEDDAILSEAEESPEVQGDSPDEVSGPSEYDTEPDDNQVAPDAKPVTGLGGIVDSENVFRTSFDSEMRKYRDAKKRFLLSLIHDNVPTNVKRLDLRSPFGNEIIVLRDLNDNKIGRGKEQKVKRERNLRVKPRSRKNSRENDGSLDSGKRKTQTTEDRPTAFPPTSCVQEVRHSEPPTNSIDSGLHINKQPVSEVDCNAPIEEFHYEEKLSPEQEAVREQKAKLRKLYRWERYQFGRLRREEDDIDHVTASNDVSAPVNLLKRREKIGDSLFKEESATRKYVDYIDHKYSGSYIRTTSSDQDQRPEVWPTPSNNKKEVSKRDDCLRLAAEPDDSKHQAAVTAVSKNQEAVPDGSKFQTATAVSETPTSVPNGSKDQAVTTATGELQVAGDVNSEIEKVKLEQSKKIKKDKKKKKRRDSSSSDDLEELEKKSEARLGKRR